MKVNMNEKHNKTSNYYLGNHDCQQPFYFPLPISRESIVLGSNFRSGDIDGFTCFEVH